MNEDMLGQNQKIVFSYRRVKGAIGSLFFGFKDIDTPSAFFFNLEKNEARQKPVACLRLADGRTTADPAEMRAHAVDFHSDWDYGARSGLC